MHHNLSFFAINLCYTPIAALQNLQRLFVCEAHHDLYVGTTKKVFEIQWISKSQDSLILPLDIDTLGLVERTLQRPRNSYSREELTLAIEDYGSLNHT
nr:hypothetical protein CFP56_33079 [Quercus suber]